MASVISRLAVLERLAKPRDGVFILTFENGGGVELLQAGARRLFRSEEDAVKTIPTGSVLIIDDL